MSEDLDIAPEMPLAFDEGLHPVAVTHPVYETPDETQDDPRREFQEKLARLLQWLAAGSNVEQAGRKVLLLAHLAGKSGCKTDRELARRLNISGGRLSQLRAEIIGDFGSLGRCNRRQN